MLKIQEGTYIYIYMLYIITTRNIQSDFNMVLFLRDSEEKAKSEVVEPWKWSCLDFNCPKDLGPSNGRV